MMTTRHAGYAVTFLLLSAAVLAGCADTPVGPSLADVPLTDVGLRSTTGNDTLCCCRVTGRLVNNNSVPVHVTIKFSAFDSPAAPRDAEPMTSLLYFVKDFQAGAVHQIDAPGLLFPCVAIQDIRSEVVVRGIAFPPF